MSEWTDVGPAEEIAPGEWRTVIVDDIAVAVFNIGGEFLAIEDICTHDNSPLTGGAVCGEEITCPRHAARFNLRTGEALSPPAYEPVPVLPARVSDGIVQVRDDRWD